MVYRRPQGTAGRAGSDFFNSDEFESEVGDWLGEYKISHTDATDKLDYWIPGAMVEVKEKRQKLSSRWTVRVAEAPEEDLFVIDELSVRRAMQHFPSAYFLIRDVPGGNRHFLARVDEVCAAERVRFNRTTTKGGSQKGKWLLSLQNFRLLEDPANELLPAILADQVSTPWKASHCLSRLIIPEV